MKVTMNSIRFGAGRLPEHFDTAGANYQIDLRALDFLKTESAINVVYEYDGLTVGSGTEKEYIDKKVAEGNKDEDGKGDRWLESWKADRAKRYQPKFEELVSKQFTARKSTLNIGANKDAKYTLVLQTTNLEPGWNIGISRRDAAVSVLASFVETGHRSNVLAVVSVKDAPGRGSGRGSVSGWGRGLTMMPACGSWKATPKPVKNWPISFGNRSRSSPNERPR
jgi:hypothetical protein